MNYTINGELIDINTKKEFGHGSEGITYLNDDCIYKIYYPSALDEGYGNKYYCHSYLLNIHTNQFFLPQNLIFDLNDNYVGYTSKLAKGNQSKKTGITIMPSEEFINNLKRLEEDIRILSDNNVTLADVSMMNYIYDDINHIMQIIDPGRYKHFNKSIIGNLYKVNMNQYDYLLNLLLYFDFIQYKPIGTKRKSQLLKDYIKEDKKDLLYSEYFENKLSNFDTPLDYVKTLGKYIR